MHDGLDGSEWNRFHVLGLDSFSNVKFIDQISIPCPLFNTGKAVVRSEGKLLVTVEDFLTGVVLVIDLLLKQLDLEVFNSLSKVSH